MTKNVIDGKDLSDYLLGATKVTIIENDKIGQLNQLVLEQCEGEAIIVLPARAKVLPENEALH